MQNISVAIIDDHPLFRDGVACSLSESGIFSVLAQGGSSDEAIQPCGASFQARKSSS
jgi:two-component system nitrate/nitrite response regulator NarL